MAQRQHHMPAGQGGAVRQAQSPHGAGVVQQDFFHARAEAVFAAQCFDFRADGFDHGDQAEGADMGFGDEQDLFRRAGFDEFRQHLAAMQKRVADLGIELAVGEGAGTALAELHVGFGLQGVAAPQAPGVLGALADGLATFEDDRAKTHLRQQQGRENPAGAGADHHWAIGQIRGRMGDEFVAHRRCCADALVAARDLRGFVRHRRVHRIHQADRAFLARIKTAADHLEG